MEVKNFQDLRTWQEARQLVSEIYLITKIFPIEEKFRLVVQIKAAAISVAANIAEGMGRETTNDLCRFLIMARGSVKKFEKIIFMSRNTPQSLQHSNTSTTPTLLLHTCCGICGAWLPERLSREFKVTIFYFNPNIHPHDEYKKRLIAVQQMSEFLKLPMIEGEYNPQIWFDRVRGLAHDREGGTRCSICFEIRLRRTAEEAKRLGFDYFATTLTIGRRKPATIINSIGEKIAVEVGVNFLAGDFKKHGGEMESQKRGKEFGLYHQNYCGCVYSRLENKKDN